jgi:hypothetical protein
MSMAHLEVFSCVSPLASRLCDEPSLSHCRWFKHRRLYQNLPWLCDHVHISRDLQPWTQPNFFCSSSLLTMLCSPTTPTSKYTLRHRQRAAYTSLPALGLLSDSTTASPRFSRLLGTVLGSPFLTTSDIPLPSPDLDIVDGAISAVPRSFTITRPSSPTPSNTLDTFSIISPSEIPDVFTMSDCPDYSIPPSSSFFFRSPSRGMRPILQTASSPGATFVNTSPNPLKSLLPRIWDALSSPGKTTLIKPHHSSSPGRGGKGKGVATNLGLSLSGFNYQDLPPLDGEEGELIDDEACFIDVMAVTGIGMSWSLVRTIHLMLRFKTYYPCCHLNFLSISFPISWICHQFSPALVSAAVGALWRPIMAYGGNFSWRRLAKRDGAGISIYPALPSRRIRADTGGAILGTPWKNGIDRV